MRELITLLYYKIKKNTYIFISFFSCSHSLIVFSVSTSSLRVYLGRRRQEGVNTHEISRNVRTIIVHPSYDRNTHNNDIALLQLSSTVTFNDYIRPVCLAAQSSVFSSGTSSWITGWGDVQAGGTNTYKPIHSSVYLLLTSLIDGCVCVLVFSEFSFSWDPAGDYGSSGGQCSMQCFAGFWICYQQHDVCWFNTGRQRHLPGTMNKQIFDLSMYSYCITHFKIY